MTATIQPAEWLRHIDREYLSTYIRGGGTAIKFAVPMEDGLRADLFAGLAVIGNRAGYLAVNINAAETKVHMVDELFFRTAEQIPWTKLSRMAIAKIAAESGYSWADNGDEPLYGRLAEENRLEPQLLLIEMKQAIWKKVFKQRNLSKDFRVAMTHLCIAELTGGPDGATAIQALTDWLTGRNRAVSAVKPFQIFRKINRATGRHFYESLANWVRFAGYPGMVILLDAQRVTLARNPKDNGLFYSKAAVMDSYEVLRQFIDAADQLNGCLLTVVPDIAFLEDHEHGRGIGAYNALKFRVFDEVRDKRLVNPMTSLARISASERGV